MKKQICSLAVIPIITTFCLFNTGFTQELEPGQVLPELTGRSYSGIFCQCNE